MKIEVEILEHDEKALFLHQEIGTFDGGRVITTPGGGNIIVEVKGMGKYEVKAQAIVNSVMNHLFQDENTEEEPQP